MTGRIPFVFLTLVLLAGSYQSVNSQKTNSFNGLDLVDKTGNIRKPTDYRERYELLGTYTVLDPKGDQMHVTYATPGTAEYYRKAGTFPDGAVLVKEIYGTDHAKLTTGDAYWAKGINVWFVQIKDTKTAIQTANCGVMDGGGRFSKPTHLTSRWRLITRKIALAVTSQPRQPTGHTYRAIQYSCQSKTSAITVVVVGVALKGG